jgi:predicted phage gp36 major capsid-like protein
MNVDTMTRDAAVDQMTAIHERLEQLHAKPKLSRADGIEFDNICKEFNELHKHVEKLDRAAVIAGVAGEGGGGFRIERGTPGDPYAGERNATSPQRDSAMRGLERAVKGGLAGRAAEVVERLLDNGTDVETSWVSRWVTDTGSAEYRSAFAKLLMHGEQSARLQFTPAERSAFDRVARLKADQRAMSLTDSSGGFLVPFELDPSINIVNAGSTNPLLQIADVKTVVTDIWHGINSAGVVAEWLAEAAEADDASPALAEPEIPCRSRWSCRVTPMRCWARSRS